MSVKLRISIIIIQLVFTIRFPQTLVSAAGSLTSLFETPSPVSVFDPVRLGNTELDVPLELTIEGIKTLPIVQQPPGNSNFVSSVQENVTAFQTAASLGTVGLLAHNYMAGQYFLQILPGQEITLVYSGQRTKKFIVTEIQTYQALIPDSPSSNYVDLSTGKYLTATQLFNKVYRDQTGHLILQTCISAQQNPSWGRLFIIAEPAE